MDKTNIAQANGSVMPFMFQFGEAFDGTEARTSADECEYWTAAYNCTDTD